MDNNETRVSLLAEEYRQHTLSVDRNQNIKNKRFLGVRAWSLKQIDKVYISDIFRVALKQKKREMSISSLVAFP